MPTTSPLRTAGHGRPSLLLVLAALAATLAFGCGDDSAPVDGGPTDSGVDTGSPDSSMPDSGMPDSGRPDIVGMSVPSDQVLEPGVRREAILLDAPVGPANPSTSEATPTALNRYRLLRYREDVSPAADPRAILIGVPGMLGGAPAFQALAEALVRRGTAAGEPLEVWSMERRGNLLEDLRGMDTAEAMGDPNVASGYYFDRRTIDGEAFPGFLSGSDMSYASEWGLALQVEEVHQLIARVPAAERKGRVFLLGHAQGAEVCERYGAWRFADGSRGADEIAGMVLIDSDGLANEATLTETQYTTDPAEPPVGGLATIKGLDAIRADPTRRLVQIPVFGTDLLALAEILAMRANLDPTAVVLDPVRDQSLSLLLNLEVANVPPMTNAAAYGFAFDQDYASFDITALHMGKSDGPTATYTSIFGAMLEQPSDPTHTYAWIDYDATDPVEFVSLADNTASLFMGPTNLIEWYSPTRLILDLMATRGAAVPESGYQADNGLRAFDGALDDAPVLAIAAGFTTPADYDSLRARMAPALGAGRAHAGALRASDELAFKVVNVPGMTHGDPINAVDDPAHNPVPEAVHAFLTDEASAGTMPAPTLP